MEEAVSGVKGALATKIYGDDLKVLEEKSDEIVAIMRKINGIEDLGVFRVLASPTSNVTVDREAAARYQINVADVQDAIQTAVGGHSAHPGPQGRGTLRSNAALPSAISRYAGSNREHTSASRLPANASRWRSSAKSN